MFKFRGKGRHACYVADNTQIVTANHDIEVITETLNSDLKNVASSPLAYINA